MSNIYKNLKKFFKEKMKESLSKHTTFKIGGPADYFVIVDNKDKWFSYLPHYIAELCENEEDEERRRALFLYVIHTSLASDTVSAVRRLIRGNQRAKFVDYVKDYRMRIEHLFSNYPLWVAAKLRGLLSSMHVH